MASAIQNGSQCSSASTPQPMASGAAPSSRRSVRLANAPSAGSSAWAHWTPPEKARTSAAYSIITASIRSAVGPSWPKADRPQAMKGSRPMMVSRIAIGGMMHLGVSGTGNIAGPDACACEPGPLGQGGPPWYGQTGRDTSVGHAIECQSQMGIGLEAVVILLLIVVNGWFSMSELALVSARRARLAVLERKGVAGATAARALAEDPQRFLPTVQV